MFPTADFGRSGIRCIDTHAHVFTRDLPLADLRRYTPDCDALPWDYLALLDAHGLSRGVLVQPSFLGTDNRYLMQVLGEHPERLRGVAVVDPLIDETQLRDMARAGVTGMRLNLFGLSNPALTRQPWRGLLERVNALDWHVEVHAQAERLPAILPALLDAGCRIVVDHFGRPAAVNDMTPLLRYADTGRVWVKLSAPYRNWADDGSGHAAALQAARELLNVFGAERLMWGSDWPHTEHKDRTCYAATLAWLAEWFTEWLDDPVLLRRVLADTPCVFFKFQ
ncbi:amidohydrolase [Bordetella sp. FB-8]|uniref:amidohydrolase family protein n=1 Tax=Bordetella sp. FB-8 TaxID=1159870 RepID=UPI000374AC4B|nr:amidohydrolase family protein [Bordetella sp. FB-8]